MTQSARMFGRLLLSSAFAAAALLASSHLAVAEEDNWPSLRQSAFGDRAIAEDGMVVLDAPQSAEDAAIVPLTVRVPPSVSQKLKSLTLFIDKNPNPLVAKISFGPAAGTGGERSFSTRGPHRQFLLCARGARDRGWQSAHRQQIRGGGGRLCGDASQGSGFSRPSISARRW